MLVELVTDFVCPWCYIGKRRFDQALETLRSEGVTTAIEVRLRSFQLDPSAPVGAPAPVRDSYARRFGGEARADEILRHVSGVAADAGIRFDMDAAVRANTRRAHRLVKIAQSRRPELQSAINESVMRAYFSEGRDIDDASVLVDCAERAGFEPDGLLELLGDEDPDSAASRAVQHDLDWATERGITAVPTFVVGESFAIPGAQDVATLVRLLRRMIVAV